ncbi:MAG: AIR carboxylase family protein [Chloroflexi bacterium]|nr:MAG: AIR carboxylase family protein [Chloroflexota bacterium]
MEACVKVLDDLGLAHEVKVCSAHRNPRGVMDWASSARERGLKVVIAAAGGAAHLPGVVAAWATVAIGEAGAKNAAWLAARILGVTDVEVERRHQEKRAALAAL